MNNSVDTSSNRSVHIGGNASGNVISIGDGNTMHYQQVTLPSPQSVNIQGELMALSEILGALESPHIRKITNAIEEAGDELGSPAPEKDEMGRALERALEYAHKADSFATIIEKLKPHVVNTAAWLGGNWQKLLSFVGVTA